EQLEHEVRLAPRGADFQRLDDARMIEALGHRKLVPQQAKLFARRLLGLEPLDGHAAAAGVVNRLPNVRGLAARQHVQQAIGAEIQLAHRGHRRFTRAKAKSRRQTQVSRRSAAEMKSSLARWAKANNADAAWPGVAFPR